MVRLHVKTGDETLFLYDTTVGVKVEDLIKQLVRIQNKRLKIQRICYEIEALRDHGVGLPHHMQGLTEEQVYELKLVDEWAAKCEPSGGVLLNKDPTARRCGNSPKNKMKEILTRTIEDARARISKKQVDADVSLDVDAVELALDQLKGAVTIVYPMGLPPHDPIDEEFRDLLDVSGTQAGQEVLSPSETDLWWASKKLEPGKTLKDYLGSNEKTKIVAKLQKQGHGAPARENPYTEEERKQMMLHAYRRQEEVKKLIEDDDHSYLNSSWADNLSVKRQLHGVDKISWKPK